MNRIMVLTALTVLVASPAWARCEIDQQHSLQDMAASNKPWSNKIPSGFKIDPHRIAFAVSTAVGPIELYSLPSDVPGQGEVLGAIGSSWSTFRETAECRVRAPDGRWWLVTKHVDGNLSYVLQSRTVPEHHR